MAAVGAICAPAVMPTDLNLLPRPGPTTHEMVIKKANERTKPTALATMSTILIVLVDKLLPLLLLVDAAFVVVVVKK